MVVVLRTRAIIYEERLFPKRAQIPVCNNAISCSDPSWKSYPSSLYSSTSSYSRKNDVLQAGIVAVTNERLKRASGEPPKSRAACDYPICMDTNIPAGRGESDQSYGHGHQGLDGTACPGSSS